MIAHQSVEVGWIDDADMQALARERGYVGENSLADFVDYGEVMRFKSGFSSVTKAKAWAVRNRTKDIFCNPEIRVYEYPDEHKHSYEAELVRYLRYIGSGDGWEELDA